MLEPIAVLSLYAAPDGTLGGLLASRTAAAPDREFLVFKDRTTTYRAFAGEVERAAAMLAARGVGAGDRVGVMSLNHPARTTSWSRS